MTKIVGIDLGTSNSAAAVMQAGRPVIVPSAEGTSLYGKAFPSVVAFTKDDQMLVGEPARRQAVSNPEGTVIGAKRKMGTDFKYRIHGKTFTPQQISAFILQKIKRDAEEFLGEKVEKAVITVPAYFDDNQRQATKDAGTIAGLEVVRIVNEPTAASLAYGIDKQEKESKILVFDLGGGTLDVTIMELGDGVFEVKATSGDTQLGGTDMDLVLMNFIIKEFEKQTGIDLNDDKTAVQRIREAAERSKIELSTMMETEINLPFIHGTNNLQMKITRSKLEELIEPIVAKCKKPLMQAIKDAKLEIGEIHKIILVGGPTRMPIVRKFVEDTLDRKAERGIDPMECVALGAAVQAGVLGGEVKDILLLDVTPLTLGIETLGGIRTPLIQRNTTIPTKKSQVFSTAEDNQTAVTIHVLQGEREMATDNKSLGRFDLVGIPPAQRGIPQIEVAFDIDANGIVHVSAKDLGTGKVQSIKITATEKLSKEEIEKMQKEAEKFAEDDKKKKEGAEIKNQAEALVYTIEKTVKDLGEKLEKEKLAEVEREKNELKDLIKANDTTKLKKKMDELNKLVHEMSSKMYQEAMKQEKEAKDHEVKKDNKEKKDKVVDAEVIDDEDAEK
ncbi:MAG TPA: molecular chaperone DnaK [Candidatus Nanoarchaeia archaeon]|nr:molecular chaperone DnaK [Candidatus Nanoarchaeia archaeon]